MSNNVAEPDITLASTTESQAELDHATGPNWREHFTPPAKEGEQQETPQPGETPKPGATEKKEPASDAGGKKAGTAKGESGAENDDDDNTPLPKGVQRRIDRLTARLRATEDELAASRGTRQQQPQPKTPAEADPEPKQGDFKSWDEWHEAHTRWAVRDENRRASTRSAQEDADARMRETYDDHLARTEAARTTHADFDDVVRGAGTFNFASQAANRAFQMALIEADNGPEVLYHLAKNPDEMAKFAELSPVKVQLLVGRFSAALSPSDGKPVTPKPKSLSNTPAPAARPQRQTTVTGKSYLNGEDAKTMSTDEWIKARDADLRARKQRRN